MKKILLGCISFLFMAAAFASSAPQEGVDYAVIPQAINKVKTKPSKTVNVKEFFSFTCIHCKDVEPLIEAFVSSRKVVELEKIQAVWGDDLNMRSFAKLNATIQIMKLNRLYIPAFDAVFSRQNINDPEILKTFLKSNGLNNDQIGKFMNMYNSFDVSIIVAKYKTMTEDPKYNITGTPTFIVADKYIISPALPARLVEVVNALVTKSTANK